MLILDLTASIFITHMKEKLLFNLKVHLKNRFKTQTTFNKSITDLSRSVLPG